MGKIAGMGLGMANNVLLARLLGPESLGVYFILMKICNLAGLLSQLGTNTMIVKLVGIAAGTGDWGKLKGILRSTFVLILVSSGVMVLLIWAIKHPLSTIFHSPALAKIMFLGLAIVPLQNFLLLVGETFRGLQNLKVASLLPVLQQAVLLLALIFLAVYLNATLQKVLLGLCLGLLFALAVGFFLLGSNYKNWLATPEPVKPSTILRDALPMMVTSGALLVIHSADIYILGIFTNASEVGIYGVVSSLAGMTVLSLGIINQVIPAMIAHHNAQKDFKTLTYVIRYASTIGTLSSVPVLILMLLGGKSILTLLFGAQYTSGTTALTFLVICQLYRSITGPCGYVLQMTGLHVTFMKISLASGLLNILLNLVLVQHFGKNGVAAATAFSLIMQNTASLLMVRWKTGIWTLASLKITREIMLAVRRRLCTFF